jgi:preprotein translocase subunit Sec63
MGKLLLLLGIAIAIMLWWGARKSRASAMQPADARALLGLQENASLVDIRDAHRRLIAKVHPDAGGSKELAARVNQARDTLVAELNRRTPSAS